MLEAMYSPQTESRYLSYATNLLLEMTSKSPDFNREMFEHPLSQCKFEVCVRVCVCVCGEGREIVCVCVRACVSCV